MAQVSKCDSCGALDHVGNRVENESQVVELKATGLLIVVSLPSKYHYKHLCRQCLGGIISARFAELCGLLAPYQPARVSGFIQDGTVVDEPPMTADERKALAVLSRRLLKA